jgi:hypothetical protein
MPIYSHLDNSALAPEEIKVIAEAFEATCQKLGLVHRQDPLRDSVAKAIIECVQSGERNPLRLEEFAQAAIKREWSLGYFISGSTRPSRSS